MVCLPKSTDEAGMLLNWVGSNLARTGVFNLQSIDVRPAYEKWIMKMESDLLRSSSLQVVQQKAFAFLP